MSGKGSTKKSSKSKMSKASKKAKKSGKSKKSKASKKTATVEVVETITYDDVVEVSEPEPEVEAPIEEDVESVTTETSTGSVASTSGSPEGSTIENFAEFTSMIKEFKKLAISFANNKSLDKDDRKEFKDEVNKVYKYFRGNVEKDVRKSLKKTSKKTKTKKKKGNSAISKPYPITDEFKEYLVACCGDYDSLNDEFFEGSVDDVEQMSQPQMVKFVSAYVKLADLKCGDPGMGHFRNMDDNLRIIAPDYRDFDDDFEEIRTACSTYREAKSNDELSVEEKEEAKSTWKQINSYTYISSTNIIMSS